MNTSDRTIALLLRKLTAANKRELRATREADLLRHVLLTHADADARREDPEILAIDVLVNALIAQHFDDQAGRDAALEALLKDLDALDDEAFWLATWEKRAKVIERSVLRLAIARFALQREVERERAMITLGQWPPHKAGAPKPRRRRTH